MLKSTRTFLFIMAAAFALSSCRGDGTVPTPSQSLPGSWLMTANYVDPPQIIAGQPISDLFSNLSPCIQDNQYVFERSGLYIINEGLTACGPNAPQERYGNWWLNAEESMLYIDMGSYFTEYFIVNSERNRLIIRSTDTTGSIPRTSTETFNKVR